VSEASIVIDGVAAGAMGQGFVILLGVGRDDEASDLEWLLGKCLELRVFEDDDGKMNRSVMETAGSVLLVSQFTLFGNVRKGNRPSFNKAALPELATPLYEAFVDRMRHALGVHRVLTGSFGADMKVQLINDGPVTIILDSRQKDF
jgi:D-aminoacyl-tRNA deacylase